MTHLIRYFLLIPEPQSWCRCPKDLIENNGSYLGSMFFKQKNERPIGVQCKNLQPQNNINFF